eukprot:CAMPEP_0194258266 /NCGR_PEP_ID=MMETSP0158-20130606/40914_1 /TAXON_ID=33649 /ORGANISM="Thalassionema nitzschioides, Strain L26-B" /LENGTH=176 /DNA_ID=CAMNT_0038997613 /DNA_START=147 /DNA_END=677 /DNA_ORIENTATION=-
MAIGRLDEDSEGLLLLTTDGKTSHRFRSGEEKVEKEYYCQVDGIIIDEAVEAMKAGLEINIQGQKVQTLPCQSRRIPCPNSCDEHPLPECIPKPVRKIRDVRHGPTSWVSITLTEGKYRQVRKMTAAVGYPTLRLVRVRIGDVTLLDDGMMRMGEVRKIQFESSSGATTTTTTANE